jgi:hypothetical protein
VKIARNLSKKQLAVIEDIFAGELTEQAILNKHKVSRNVYNKWLADECFRQRFDERVASAYRQSELIRARYAPLAAAKLVELMGSDKPETVRKACLDVISFRAQQANLSKNDSHAGTLDQSASNVTEPNLPQLSNETASKILSILANEQ